MVDGDFKFTEKDFRAIASMLREDAGIALPESKATLVYARLGKRLRTLGFDDFSQYTSLLAGPGGDAERREMLTALTTNVTRFFREPHHFEHLRTEVLPPLLRAAQNGGRVRLWSSACSSGQEPYSLAATVLDLLPGAADLDFKVLATDIDSNVLDQARAGRYGTIEGVPPKYQRWFEQDRSSWSAVPALKRLVSFRLLNLTARWPMRGPFDVVLCRNVAIYFDAGVQSQLWADFSKVIPSRGMLYIGHSERISGPAADAFENVGITAYRRCGGRA
ncbi:MAG: protein-glutamate O-methyltransferase CheR [Acetobacteraceae bacterium]